MSENQKEQVTVENLIDAAIIKGFQQGIMSFMEHVETSLTREVNLTESGGAESYLQEMLDSTIQEKEIQESYATMEDLNSKIAKVLGK